ncbi:MAG: hypothetical protein LQ339_003162 [Xanthoria mediterranea]|nr:MAG: hypothetical protein LQ339_003162 [Xanthoria mediterranea]
MLYCLTPFTSALAIPYLSRNGQETREPPVSQPNAHGEGLNQALTKVETSHHDNVEISHPGGTGATTSARTRPISKVAKGEISAILHGAIPPDELRNERLDKR